jgi:hypothetical protein
MKSLALISAYDFELLGNYLELAYVWGTEVFSPRQKGKYFYAKFRGQRN